MTATRRAWVVKLWPVYPLTESNTKVTRDLGSPSSLPADFSFATDWLESERERYAELTAELESKVFTVTKDKIRDSADKVAAARDSDSEAEVHPIWKTIDAELEELPSALCNAGNDLWIEWVYTIDLDSELFSVDNWVFFDLWDIPRDRWLQGFTSDEQGRKTFDFEICPEGSVGTDPPDYFPDDTVDDRNKYHAIYQQYNRWTVQADRNIDRSSPASLQQTVSLLLFERCTTPHCAYFWEYVPGWGHKDFAFRELAFAILSIASGRYYFDRPDRLFGDHLHRDRCNGFLIDADDTAEPDLMPIFGSACHIPDQEPGSAPDGHMYWFENVLISLVPNTVFEVDTEAAIAKAVERGLEEGKVGFQIVMFSIFRAIMLEVHVHDGIKKIRRTGIVSIYNARRKADGDEEDKGAASPFEMICRKQSGFISLQNFFNSAANRNLAIFGQGCFPTEIYAKIIADTDNSTHNACAKVSRTFRELCQDRFSFSKDFTILRFEESLGSLDPPYQNQRQSRCHLGDTGTFTFQDWRTGDIMSSALDVRNTVYKGYQAKVPNWCPVVGGAARPSMMTQFRLRLGLPN